MSCGCSNTTSTVTTTNCGSCGYNCSNCTCPTNPIIEPAVVCADPEPCSELFPLECVIYTGPDIACSASANTLYPGVLHYLVLQNSSTTARNFVSILNNINVQLCYLFSKDYISQFLTNIQNDPTLKALFCTIASSCNCLCTLTCPIVTNLVYNVNTSPASDTVTGGITQSVGGSKISFQGTIVGTTLTIGTGPSVGTISIGQKITGPGISPNTFITAAGVGSTWTISVSHPNTGSIPIDATKIEYKVSLYKFDNGQYYYQSSNTQMINPQINLTIPSGYNNSIPWLVSVQAIDKIAELLGQPTCEKGTYFPYSNIPLDPNLYSNINLSCGFGVTRAVPAPTCYNFCLPACPSRAPINSICNSYWGVNNLGQATFTFTHNQPANTYPVLSYTFHWYVKLNNQNTIAVQANDVYSNELTAVPDVVIVNPNNPIITGTLSDVYGGVPQFNIYLLLITANSSNSNCKSPFPPRRELPNNKYMGSEILGADPCNWFIYTSEKL